MAVFDKLESKIKMVILTKHGFENAVWYSILKYNKKEDTYIIKTMLRRFQEHEIYKQTNCIQFYDNSTGQFIEQYKI